MNELFKPLIYQFGLGGIGGLVTGYIAKKLTKLIALVVGLFILALLYLSFRGIISVNYEKFFEASKSILGSVGLLADSFAGLLSLLPFISSFLLGFIVGWKLG